MSTKKILTGFLVAVAVIIFIRKHASTIDIALSDEPPKEFLSLRFEETPYTLTEFVSVVDREEAYLTWEQFNKTQWLFTIDAEDKFTNKDHTMKFLFEKRKDRAVIVRLDVDGTDVSGPSLEIAKYQFISRFAVALEKKHGKRVPASSSRK